MTPAYYKTKAQIKISFIWCPPMIIHVISSVKINLYQSQSWISFALTIDNETLTVKIEIKDPEERINWFVSKGTHVLAKWLQTTNFHQDLKWGGLRHVDTDCEEGSD